MLDDDGVQRYGRYANGDDEDDEYLVTPSPIIGSFINPIGATFDSAMLTTPTARRSFVRISSTPVVCKISLFAGPFVLNRTDILFSFSLSK